MSTLPLPDGTAQFGADGTSEGGGEPPVDDPPTAVITSATCTDLTCDFDASGSDDDNPPIASYSWDFADGTTGTGEFASHTYGAAGTYNVTLTVTDGSGQSDTATTTVNPTAPPVDDPPTAVITSATCTDLTCDFDASGSDDDNPPIASYTWNFADGTTGSGELVTHTYATAGTYTVTLTVTDNDGAKTTASQTVTVTVTV